MNLHINKTEFEFLMAAPQFGQFQIGSTLYGLNDENSDIDFLVILYPFYNQMCSPFFQKGHQFQYKDVENNIDYNFIDIVSFVKNLLSGDSPINFEVLYSSKFIESNKIGWLSDFREEFRTYNLIKSYLGLVDRDIRHYHKKTGRDKISGLLHIMRGYLFAENLLYPIKPFTLEKDFLQLTKSLLQEEKFLKLKIEQLPEIREQVKSLRQILNKRFESQELVRYLRPEIQETIQHYLYNHIYWNDVKLTNLIDSLMIKIFNSNEKIEITY